MSNFSLNLFGIPNISTLDKLSELTHVSKSTLYKLSKQSHLYYHEYEIPKKSGGLRKISQPSSKLKGIQSWILVNILNKLQVSNSCKGFEKNTSIKDNVAPHAGANSILVVDIKDFFPSIYSRYVYNIFKIIGYNPLISTIFTNICTLDNALPQGSPCSPKLANLFAWKLDLRLQQYVGRKGVIYTRYADDLTFSSINPYKLIKILPTVKEIIKDEKLQINITKTRFIGISKCRKITGLVLSDESFGIGKRKYKKIRSKIFKLRNVAKIDDNLEKRKNIQLKEIYGWMAFIKNVDIDRYERMLKYISVLNDKYPDSIISNIKLAAKSKIGK